MFYAYTTRGHRFHAFETKAAREDWVERGKKSNSHTRSRVASNNYTLICAKKAGEVKLVTEAVSKP